MTAVTREGVEINVGDTVLTNFRGCKGYEFTVCEIHPYEHCESKYFVVLHLKGSPERIIKSPFEGKDGRPAGFDTNWVTKVEDESK